MFNSPITRRGALRSLSTGFGYLAFAGLADAAARGATARDANSSLLPKEPHFPARASA